MNGKGFMIEYNFVDGKAMCIRMVSSLSEALQFIESNYIDDAKIYSMVKMSY